MGARRPEPDRDDVTFANEHRGLAIGDAVAVELRRLDADEDLAAEDFQLGHLLEIERILNRERMQPKILLDNSHFLGRRIVQADPDEFPRCLRCQSILKRHGLLPVAILVEKRGNDAHGFTFQVRDVEWVDI